MVEEYAVSVDLGATNVRVAIGNHEGRILARLKEKTDKEHGPEGIPAQIAAMIKALLEKTGLTVRGIGVGSIGPMDLKRGILVESPNIPFDAVPLTEILRETFKLPIILLNDAKAAAVGEKEFGKGKDFDNMVYITLGTGIGGGAIVDGRLLLGKDGNASEIGHMVVDVEGELVCGCGRRGHWEAYCSGKNIPNYVRLLLEKRGVTDSLLTGEGGAARQITAKTLFEAAKQGDKPSLEIVDSIGRLNAAGFANTINAFDPSFISVGGALALNNKNLIIKPIKKYVTGYTINRIPQIEVTRLGENIVLLGALAAIFKNLDHRK